jgi:hypothetical protein
MRRSAILIGLIAIACGGRPAGWDEPFEAEAVVGLQTSVAVMDPALDRVIMLESPNHLGLKGSTLPVGKGIVTATPSPTKDRLFVLSQGEQPRKKKDDELPRLTVIDTVPTAEVTRTYDLSDPFSGLSLDPEGRWVIVHAGEGVLENPNELILIDLENLDAEPHIKSIRSFGGRPARFTFTSPLMIAGEPRRVLIVQTEQDLALIDLMELDDDEITVLTPVTESALFSQPELVAFHDADQDSEPVLAVSFANSSSVLLIELVAGDGDEHEFLPQINTSVEVGGKPTAIDFVETDGGLRLAALVPSARHAALVDPKTTAVDLVPMPIGFTGLTRITDALDGATGTTDSALLWTEAQGVVGIWQLDVAIGAPYNSVETFDINVAVGQVLDVPGPNEGACGGTQCFTQYKIVETAGAGDFYLLDLNQREASLMVTNGQNLELSLSPDGERLWAFQPDGERFAQVSFSNLHPISLATEAPIRGVFDVGRPNGGGDGARSAIVLHMGAAGIAATVFDALEPDGAVTKFYSGLVYEGLSR